jgi:SP family arabinose:H+ symporter-like MFS transporter
MNLKFVYFITTVAALGGFLFGYDTAVIAGAIGFLETKFNLTPAMTGWAASSAIWGCVMGSMGAGYLSDKYGRKTTLIITAVLFAISSIGSAVAMNLTQFVISRILGGIGIGAASMLSPLYISEMAPAEKRGMFVTLYQLAIVIGINIIYFINLMIAGSGTEQWNIDFGWRYMLGSGTVPSVLFLTALFLVPESPRWLALNGKEEEALNILQKTSGTVEAQSALKQIKLSAGTESGKLKDLFAPGLRTAMIIGLMLALFSQITGINAIIYYAPEIFKNVGFGTDAALLQTVIIGLTNTVFTFVAITFIDRAGRRKLLLWGVLGMLICLMGIGVVFYFKFSSGPLLLLFILGFIACFASSLGPIPWVIIAEIFPNKLRGLAMSISILVLWFGVVLITQLFPILINQAGGALTFWIFGINALVLLVFTYKWIPETKGKTLEEIEKSWVSN